jgi:excisionase family DNA binding protein
MTNLIVTTPQDLAELIHNSVRSALSNAKLQSADSGKPLSMDEAADFLGIPKATLYQFTSKRLIPFRKLGRRIVFSKADLATFLETKKKESVHQIEANAWN